MRVRVPPAGAAGHFQLRSERSWLEAAGAGTTSRLLTLDVHRAAAALSRVPLPDRLSVDLQHFTVGPCRRERWDLMRLE